LGAAGDQPQASQFALNYVDSSGFWLLASGFWRDAVLEICTAYSTTMSAIFLRA
jgi:hypothetical protein